MSSLACRLIRFAEMTFTRLVRNVSPGVHVREFIIRFEIQERTCEPHVILSRGEVFAQSLDNIEERHRAVIDT